MARTRNMNSETTAAKTRTRDRRWALIMAYAFLLLFVVFFLFPPFYMLLTSLKTNRVDVKVKGEEGKGESKSEIIKGASEEGFASRKYKEVYGDYSSVVEEVMEKENVPKGYRYYVKRYFQLIKPREQE